MYTTHGYMTPEDRADHDALYDLNLPDEPGPRHTSTRRRQEVYGRSGRPLTPRQRRRLVKKAGRDPYATVVQDDGMGFPPALRGYREVVSTGMRPVSGIPAYR